MSSPPQPTPAQRRTLLAAIANDGRVPAAYGAAAYRLHRNLFRLGFTTAGGEITEAGRRAVADQGAGDTRA